MTALAAFVCFAALAVQSPLRTSGGPRADSQLEERASKPDASATSPTASQPTDVSAVLYLDPARAEVGEPVDLVLAIEHPAALSVSAPDAAPLPDETGKSAPTWVALGERRVARFEIDGGARARTLHRWSIASLVPGDRSIGPVKIGLGDASEKREISTQAASLSVGAVLAEGEDAPRPAKGFLPPPASRAPPATWVGLVLVVLVAAYVAWRVVKKRRRAAVALVPVTPLSILSDLEKRAVAAPEDTRPITCEALFLLRRAIDEFVGESRAALTDSAWIALVEKDERVPIGARTATVRMLAGAERVKYALETPTRFALLETLASVRAVLEALASAPALEKKEAA